MSLSLQPRGLQHARLPCPSQSPGACSNSCPLSQWCHPTISSSFIPFSSCLQSFPASVSFPMSRLFASGGQRIEASASASVLPVNIQGWFPLGWTGLISLQPKELSRVFSNTTVQRLCILFNKTLKSLFSKMRFYTHYKFWLWSCTGCRFAPPVFFHLQFRLKDIIPWNIACSSTHSVHVHLNVLWGDKKLKLLITHDIHHIHSYSIDQSMVRPRVHREECY